MWISRLFFLIGCWILILCALQLIPLFTALLSSEAVAFQALLSAFVFSLLVGGALFLGFRSTERIRIPKLTIFLPIAGATVLAFFAGLPFFFLHPDEGLIPAYYEGMSLITTNGTSAYEGIALPSFSIELWRVIVAWAGGFMALCVALSFLTAMNIGGLQLHRSPLPLGDSEAGYPRLKSAAKTLYPLYILITLTCFILLVITGVQFDTAMIMSMAIISTTGITVSLSGDMQGVFPQLITLVFLLISMSNWDMQYALWNGKKFKRRLNVEFQTTIFLIIILFTLMLILAPTNAFRDLFNHLFAIVSSLSTFGVFSEDYGISMQNNVDISIIFLIGAGIGGAAISTSGGLKQLRAIIVYFTGKAEVERLAHPHSVKGVLYQGADVQQSDIDAIWLFLGGFILLLAAGTLALAVFGIDFQDALSMSFSALTLSGPIIYTVDAGFGGFAGLQSPDYIILSILMLVGRIEVSLFLALFSKALWRG